MQKDEKYWNIINAVFSELRHPEVIRNMLDLYALLERANLEFMKKSAYYCPRKNENNDIHYEETEGIDSSSEDNEDERNTDWNFNRQQTSIISHKFVVPTRMRAINITHFFAMYIHLPQNEFDHQTNQHR